MKNTHRVVMEHDTSGHMVMMFRGSRSECMGYRNEWLNHQRLLHNPGDTAKYLRSGWSMYIMEIELDSVLRGRERKYRVLGEPLIDLDNPDERSEADARRAIMATIHFGHPLVEALKRVYGESTPIAVRHARQQVMDRWLEGNGAQSIMQVIDQVTAEEMGTDG